MRKIGFNNIEIGNIYLIKDSNGYNEFIVKPIKKCKRPSEISKSTVNYFKSYHYKIIVKREYATKLGEIHDFGFFNSDKIYKLSEKELLARLI